MLSFRISNTSTCITVKKCQTHAWLWMQMREGQPKYVCQIIIPVWLWNVTKPKKKNTNTTMPQAVMSKDEKDNPSTADDRSTTSKVWNLIVLNTRVCE